MNEEMKAAFARGVELAKIARLEGESARESEGVHTHIHSRADELIACLEGEIAKRDARIVELELEAGAWKETAATFEDFYRKTEAELAAIKAQEPVAWRVTGVNQKHRHPHIAIEFTEVLAEGQAAHWRNRGCTTEVTPLYAAPVSEAKSRGVEHVQWQVRYLKAETVSDGWWQDSSEQRAAWCAEANQQQHAKGQPDTWEIRRFAIAAPVQQVCVPDGWKWVPVDATLEMVEAFKARVSVTNRGGLLNCGHALNAAIAAAPAPSTPEGQGDE